MKIANFEVLGKKDVWVPAYRMQGFRLFFINIFVAGSGYKGKQKKIVLRFIKTV
jgi:hypothetical protein